ncbi:MAG: hypothetical protein IJU23_08155 [Proteobacteria bacterium]|nr:hypothetical protein [Pseudomonadota bacterium]
MHHKHILAICLIISAILFVAISIGMVTEYSNIAIGFGMALVFLMTCGFFYATLHLSKFNIAAKSENAAPADTKDAPKADDEKAADTKDAPKADDEKPKADDEKPAETTPKADDAKPADTQVAAA